MYERVWKEREKINDNKKESQHAALMYRKWDEVERKSILSLKKLNKKCKRETFRAGVWALMSIDHLSYLNGAVRGMIVSFTIKISIEYFHFQSI